MTIDHERLTGPDPLPRAGSSVWLVGQRNLTTQRRGRFVPESAQHPGRMSPDLAAEAIRRYTRPGDLVLDPMCGIGTTLVEAVHDGRHAVGVDCEPRWTGIARANLDLATMRGATGSGDVVTGDARHLGDLAAAARGHPLDKAAGRARLLLTSPPYGPSTHGRVRVPQGEGPVVSHLDQHYTPGRRRHSAAINLAYLDAETMTTGLTDILAAALPLLTSDATVVITARPWRQDGLLVDLPGLVITAAEKAGLRLVERCVALLAAQNTGRLMPRHSFFQLLAVRSARDRGNDWLLIAHEDLLIFRVAESSPALASVQ